MFAFYKDVLAQYGSPLYVYDEQTLRNSCYEIEVFKTRLEESIKRTVRMHYSTKANSNPAILSIIKDYGLSVDCMSPYELAVNEKCGFSGDDILYVCNNIDVDEMRLVHDRGYLICLDSVSQVTTWGQHFPGTNIMVRINPGVTGVGHSEKVKTSGKLTKFGVTEDNIPFLLNVAKKYNLKIIGIHQHLGSLFLDDKIPDYIAGVKAGLNIIEKYFRDIEIIDLGGGFGVPYHGERKLSLDTVRCELAHILKEFINNCPSVREFKFEPGRYIPCEAGKILGTVTAVEKRYDTWWIGTDIGMNVLVRPSMYDSYHEINVYCSNYWKEDEVIHANICGNICESGDVLGKDRIVELPEVGDVVVVENAGAYGFSMASNYTGRPRPAEVMLLCYPIVSRSGISSRFELMRKRETVEDMMRNIVW